MADENIALNDATPEQIRHHCEINFGLEIAEDEPIEQITTRLLEIQPAAVETGIPNYDLTPTTASEADRPEVAASPPPEPPVEKPVVERYSDATSRGDPVITVEIAKEPHRPGSIGTEPAKVGVNGKMMLIPRGRPVQIPFRYYLALLEARETQYVQRETNAGEFILDESIAYAYPFSVQDAPSREEVGKWYADQGVPSIPAGVACS